MPQASATRVSEFFLIALPVFAATLLGWAAARLALSSAAGVEALAAFSYRFALPAPLLRLNALQPIGSLFSGVFFVGYLIAHLRAQRLRPVSRIVGDRALDRSWRVRNPPAAWLARG